MVKLNYRSDIDGLRAIAVLMVIVYHAQISVGSFTFFKGGFIGVDIFFVISGYLITTKIFQNRNSSSTQILKDFYWNRIKRIAPAMLFSVLIISLFSWFTLLPNALVDYAKSAIASLFFVTNIYWEQSIYTYGEPLSNVRPLFHFWSLAIEEQFYLIFPIIFIFLTKKSQKHTGLIFLILAIASLVWAEFSTRNAPSSSYFFFTTRAWEILLGSLLALFHINNQKESSSRIISIIAFAAIIASSLFLDFSLYHPGFITLIPTIATIILLNDRNGEHIIQRALKKSPLVYIGRISFSLYIYHFSVFAFMRLMDLYNTTYQILIGIGISFVLASISFHFIEQPFRNNFSKKKVYSILGLILLINLLILFLIIKNNGNIIQSDRSELLKPDVSREKLEAFWLDLEMHNQIKDLSQDKFSIYIIGNSWAYDLVYTIKHFTNYEFFYYKMSGHHCRAITLNALKPSNPKFLESEKRCKTTNQKYFNKVPKNTNLIIIADNGWFKQVHIKKYADEITKNIQKLRNTGYENPILIISDRPNYKMPVPLIVNTYGSLSDKVNEITHQYLRRDISILRQKQKYADLFYKNLGVYHYSLLDPFCDKKSCKIVHNKEILVFDDNHLTPTGTKFFAPYLIEYIEKNFR